MRLLMRALIRRQRGASYSLPFVMVVPFYLVFVLAVFEAGFLVLARVQTQYAAHAAARSAVVWRSTPDPAIAELNINRSAWMSLAPCVLTRWNGDSGPLPTGARESAPGYGAAIRRASTGSGPSAQIMEQKFLKAAARTTVTVEELKPGDSHGLLRVTVTFRAPLYFPVASRFLDPDGSPPFEYPLTATVTFPNEAPESESRTLGIDYRPARPTE